MLGAQMQMERCKIAATFRTEAYAQALSGRTSDDDDNVRRHTAFVCEPTPGDFRGLFGFTQVS